MATVHDIAARILEFHGPMSAMKLQKLVYYSQAWSLTLADRPLFQEEIRAWAYGPVVYELFQRHRGQFVVATWAGASHELTVREREIVRGVLGYYGRMSADALSRLTHEEDPWRQARAGCPEGERSSAVITHESMRRFYSRMKVPFSYAA